MTNIVINAPQDAEYLSGDWMKEIPVNCVLNKGVTGCGATTLAIEQPGHTILAMPYCGLVDNKVKSSKNLLGIHDNMDREGAIINYLANTDTIKIATTYDSLPLVRKVLSEQGYDPYKDMFLCVDEWHAMFNSYMFRHKAVRGLLQEASKFERKTYVSATPLPREYWLKELQELPEYKIIWPNAKQVNIVSTRVPKPLETMARDCKSRLTYGGEENYHIFLNSVRGISTIIRLAGLTPDICRIVCSSSDSSKDRNQEKLPEGFTIQTTNDTVKLFNFYTSTCFEGQDILDEKGRTFIVSEGHKDHTKMDIMTSLIQICGRIRDSKYKTEIVQYYATSKYKDVSLEEFKAATQAKLEEAKWNAEQLNKTTGAFRERIIKDVLNKEPYIYEEDGQIIVDQNIANYEIFNYGIINGQYMTQFNMTNSLTDAGFNVITGKDNENEQELNELVSISRTSFKDIFEEYVSIKEGGMFNLGCFRADRIALEKPLVKEAYEILGAEKVRQMKYHQSNIKKELTKVSHQTADTKSFLLFDEMVEKGVPILKSWIKEQLQKIYNDLHLNKTAKATNIKKWYAVKETTKVVDDGTRQSCFTIIKSLVTVKKEE